MIFAAAFLAGRAGKSAPDRSVWLRIAGMAFAAGSMIGWAVANVPLESLTVGDWIRSLGWTALAFAAPVAALPRWRQGARRCRRSPGSSAGLPGARAMRSPLVLGMSLIVLAVLSVQAALGLVFDPRYRDFPFAPLTAAAVPLARSLVDWEAGSEPCGRRPRPQSRHA